MLSISEQNADSSYKINDLAWGSETWLGVRLHVSPSAPALTRDLLAVAISGTQLDGTMLTQTASFLQLPVVEPSTFNAAPSDDLVLRRVLEVEFGKAALELRQLSRNGSRDAVLKKLKEMDHKFGEHAWLKAKLSQLHRLAEEDSEMMLKEASFTAFRMSRRLVSKSEMQFGIDETDSDIPSFLRKKESEGRGRRQHK